MELPAVEAFIKGYEVKERIGSGGFGAVYRAYQSTVGREVAIKVILPGHANQPDFIRRFEAEAHLIARLEHPYIVPLYDYWRDPEGAYLVMRWLRGGSLRDLVSTQGPLSIEEAVTMMEQAAQALHTAHRNQIIHRDIKPGNILLDEDGNAYLADFGIAKDHTITAGITEPDAMIGSPDYLAPEQARSEPVTPQTDIYSLGVVLYEMLTGQHPFPNLTPIERLFRHLNDPLPDIQTLDERIRPAINAVIQRATFKDPQQRFKDALAFAQALREAAALDSSQALSMVELLTPREQEVLKFMIAGKSNREIADALVVELSTVRWYIKQIYRKLNVRSRVQAIVKGRELDLIVGKAHAASTSLLPEPENPYKGLSAFQAADAQNFFGREKLTAKLLSRLQEKAPYQRFLALVGPSGSGKSSVVRAGLIPALWRGDLPGSDQWYIVDLLPGAHPLEELELALLRVSDDRNLNLREHLARDDRGLLRAANLVLPQDNSQLLVVIDQFEEVFTLLEDEADRQHFLDLLQTAVTDERSRVRVLVTMRADYYDRPLHYPDFGEMLRHRVETILPLSAEELERTVREPASRVGIAFEEGLVSRIVADVHYQPGALPLLQYALTELFERRDSRRMTLDVYHQIGGTGGALAKRADEIYQEFDKAGQEMVRQMFLRLVTLGEGAEDTRRRVERAELLAVAADAEVMEEIIDAYAASRLLALDHDPGTRRPTVEVAHEAILREWERLRAWLNDSRDEIRLQRSLASMAVEWHESQQDKSFLARGSRLEQFEKWAAETRLALTAAERTFLQASLTEREQQDIIERGRQAREMHLERRSRNLLKVLVTVFGIATAVAGVLALFGWSQNQLLNFALLQVGEERDRAEHNADQFRSLALAADSQLALSADRGDLALMLGHEAVKIPNFPARSQLALSEVAYAPGTRWLLNNFEGTPNIPVLSPDGRYVAFGLGRPFVELPREEDNSIRLVDLKTGEEVRVFEGHKDGVTPLAFSHDGRYLVSGSYDPISGSPETGIILWDVATGEMLRAYRHEANGFPFVFVFTPDNRYFLSLSIDENFSFVQGSITLWDVESDQPVRHLADDVGTVNVAAFSPDGRYLAVVLGDTPEASTQTRVLILDTLSGEQISTIVAEEPAVDNPGGIVIGANNIMGLLHPGLTLSTWDIETGALIQRFDREIIINAFANGTFWMLSPDGQLLANSSQMGEIQLHDLEDWTEIARFRGHPDFVLGLAFTPDRKQLVSSAFDGVRLWDLDNGALVHHYPAPPQAEPGIVNNVVFMPDGRSFVSLSRKGTLIHRHIESGEILHSIHFAHRAAWGLAVSPDGSSVLAATSLSTATLYDLATSSVKMTFPHLSDPDLDFGIAAVDISPDGRTALTGAHDQIEGMVLWDLTTGAELHRFETSLEPIKTDGLISLAYSPDGRRALVGLANGVTVLYDLATYQEIRRFGENGGQTVLFDVDFSPDGRLALSTSGDGTLILWDVESGALLHRLVGHSGEARIADFSPDGKLVASGARDETIILWDVATGQPIRRLSWADSGGGVFSLAFSPDGQYILAGGPLGQTSLWRVDATLDNLIDWTHANRYIPEPTCEERELYRIEPLCQAEPTAG